MVAEQIILPHLWRRYLSFLRALVGGACLWLVLASRGLPPGTLSVMLAVLVIYSLISLIWRWPDRLDPSGLFNLILDFLTFLLCVSLSDASGFWMAAFASFYLFLSLATLHEWREVLLFTVLSLAYVGLVRPDGVERLEPLLLLLGMTGCVLAIQRRSLLERLASSSRQAVLYRGEAQRAREAERERIAADFHDGPLQSFISFQMRVEIARRMFERSVEAGMEELRQLRDLCDRQVTELRTFVRGMRPVDVEGAGLATALRHVVAAFEKDSRITTSFQAGFEASHDDLEAHSDIIQVVREALNNVRKHSNASHVAVALSRDNGCVRLVIEDDGTGFPFAGEFTLEELELLRMGPASIKRRVRGLNGELTVESRPGQGAKLRVRVPV